MTVKERREREINEMRNLIIDAAAKIFAEEGLENVSVRKIAKRIEYSPAIIYHYFHDKDEIINHVMSIGYSKIISALTSVKIPLDQPAERLKALTRKYIEAALNMPDEFEAVQLSNSPDILAYTSSMFKGAAAKKPALGILFQCIKEIYKDKNIDDNSIELTAQVIAASTFGLIIKLIIEKDIGEEQKKLIIDHYIDMIVDRMILYNLR